MIAFCLQTENKIPRQMELPELYTVEKCFVLFCFLLIVRLNKHYVKLNIGHSSFIYIDSDVHNLFIS